MYDILRNHIVLEEKTRRAADHKAKVQRRRLRWLLCLVLMLVPILVANAMATAGMSLMFIESTKELHMLTRKSAVDEDADGNRASALNLSTPDQGSMLVDRGGEVMATRETQSVLPLLIVPALPPSALSSVRVLSIKVYDFQAGALLTKTVRVNAVDQVAS